MADYAYEYGYTVTYTGGKYVLTAADIATPAIAGSGSATHGSRVSSTNATLTGTDTITITTGSLGTLTYVGAVEDGTSYVGFLVKTVGGVYYLINDTGLTPAASTSLTVIPADGWNLTTDTYTCFMAGTLVRTPEGEVAVETLKMGDLVTLAEGGAAPVSWLGRQTVSTTFADKLRAMPIRIKANALGEGVPARDLLVSPDHALMVDGVLIQAGALVNGVSIAQENQAVKSFVYYHVEVADHSLILAENTPVETFVDNVDRMGFDNWAEHQALYGEDAPVPEMAYPRAKAARQVPQTTRARLAERAAALYGEGLAA
jgi:hypothetical protein